MPLEVEKDEEVFGVTDETESVDAANPFVNCKNMEAAEKLAGFSMKTVSEIEGYEEDAIRVIPGKLIEIIYKNADGKEIRLRKGTGTEDISGDYNSYESEETKEIGGVTVTEKSSADGIHLATWTQDDHAGALTSEEGLPAEKAEELLAQVF